MSVIEIVHTVFVVFLYLAMFQIGILYLAFIIGAFVCWIKGILRKRML